MPARMVANSLDEGSREWARIFVNPLMLAECGTECLLIVDIKQVDAGTFINPLV